MSYRTIVITNSYNVALFKTQKCYILRKSVT